MRCRAAGHSARRAPVLRRGGCRSPCSPVCRRAVVDGRSALMALAPESLSALGICLEEFDYPPPVRFLPLTNDLQPVAMAYMDVPPSTEPNGKTVVLCHG